MASQLRAMERASLKAAGIKTVEKVLLLSDGCPRILRYDFNAVAEAEVLMGGFDVAAASGDDVLRKAGTLNTLAQWAYALTSTHREDTEDGISYKEFRRLLPRDPGEIQRITAIVSAVMAPEHAEASEQVGNERRPDLGESPAESTGSGSTTVAPSPSRAATETSGD